MTSRPRLLSQAPPALRIPTVDSMKRFSIATSNHSDMPDFNINPISEDPFGVDSYVLDHIDFGQGPGKDISRYGHDGRDDLLQDSRPSTGTNTSQDDSTTRAVTGQDVHPALRGEDSNTAFFRPARTDSLRVPFHHPQPISQLTTATDGITALPTFPSYNLSAGPRDTVDCTIPIKRSDTDTDAVHKRKSSISLFAPIKRLRNFSIGSISNKLHKKRKSKTSKASVTEEDHCEEPTQGQESSTSGSMAGEVSAPAAIATPPKTPASKALASATTPRSTHNLSTTFVPSYPRSSPIESPSQPQSAIPVNAAVGRASSSQAPSGTPASTLLPASTDLSALPALQSLISNLNTENQQLKEQVKILKEDWYSTHDELLVERYNAWKKEREWELRSEGYTLTNEAQGLDAGDHAVCNREEDVGEDVNVMGLQKPGVFTPEPEIKTEEVEDVWMKAELAVVDNEDEMVGIAR